MLHYSYFIIHISSFHLAFFDKSKDVFKYLNPNATCRRQNSLADIRIFCVLLNLCSSLLEILYKESRIGGRGGVRIAEANVINVREG